MPVSSLSIANLLEEAANAILAAYERRVAELAPPGLSSSEIIDHLPDFLDELRRALRADGAGAPPPAPSPIAHTHGKQRMRLGFPIETVVREYGILSDCIFDAMSAAGLSPTLRELRTLSDHLAAASAQTVSAYSEQRMTAGEAGRHSLGALLEQSPGFIAFLRGREAVFELANAAYYQLVGHRDIIGKPLREALPEIKDQGFLELLARVITSGQPYVGRSAKVNLQRAPGASLTAAVVDFIYQPIRDEAGAIVGVLVQGHDVTEAHRAEQARQAAESALRNSEERYRTLFESIDDGFCLMQMIVDSAGKTVDYRFLEANAAFEVHTGLTNAVGKTALELVPDLDASWFELYGRVAETRQSARFENHAPAMEDRWFDIFANAVGEPSLRLVALVFKDVTARKRAEADRTRALELERDARREAEEASRLRDQFLATVSHELRTPLAAVLGWAQMLRSETLDAEKRARAVETIERNARAQAQLIEDLLDISRIISGQLRLEVEPIDLKLVVEAAIETVRPAALARDIRLQPTLSSGAIVMGDTSRLQQVIWNLLSNAVKFTPKGGRAQILLTIEDSAVQVAVADTGKGIRPDFQPFVFDRFRQADGSTSRSHGGLGLGLAIVRELVELHGGTVSVLSEGEGQGSTFTVRLPLSVARHRSKTPTSGTAAAPPKELECPPILAGMRIVVADDEDDTREMLHALLGHCSVIVTGCASAREALAAVAANPPDLLLSDIGMPGEDGYWLIEQIRALPPAAGGTVPAVALTAYARSEDRTRALHAGFDNHVSKPVEPVELLAVLSSFGRRWHS